MPVQGVPLDVLFFQFLENPTHAVIALASHDRITSKMVYYFK